MTSTARLPRPQTAEPIDLRRIMEQAFDMLERGEGIPAGGGGGGGVPTGTGFYHTTAGVMDAAAKLVDTADVNADQITYAKIQNVATNQRVLGRKTAGAGDIEELTAADLRTLIAVFTALQDGLVPASGGGTTNFLRADGTFAAPPGGGSVPTGTGFRHVTAGAEDAASKLVDTADVNNDQITYPKIQNVSATSRFLGRISALAGDIEELTGTQATTLLDVFTSLLKGLVPASGGGTVNYLRADGTFAAPPAAGAAGGDLAGTYPNPTVAHLTDTIYRLKQVVVLTSGTSYTPPSGVDALFVECVAGGGGGGAVLTALTNAGAAGGGGGGGYAAGWLTALVVGAHTIAIGGGGNGGAAGAANNGAAGGVTTFKDTGGTTRVGAVGGLGGTADTVAAGPRIGGLGAGGSIALGVGDILAAGGVGDSGIVLAAAQALSGLGGSSSFGGGGASRKTQSAGGAGLNYGGGGSGACILSGGANVAGGNGAGGFIRIWEYQKIT